MRLSTLCFFGEELSQLWLSARSADPRDLVASYVGVAVASWSVVWLGRSRMA
jgi:VanZ family protein